MHPSRRAADELCEGLDRLSAHTPGGLANFQALLTNLSRGNPACSPVQSKALIGVAMAVAQRCDCCIDRQIKCAVGSRIDRDQIVFTIRRAILMADGPALAYGAHALAKFDDLSAQSRGAPKSPAAEGSPQAPSNGLELRQILNQQRASR